MSAFEAAGIEPTTETAFACIHVAALLALDIALDRSAFLASAAEVYDQVFAAEAACVTAVLGVRR
jgi:hypothetical protein